MAYLPGMNSTSNRMGRPIDAQGDWYTLIEKAGSVQKLADMCGVSYKTIQRIALHPEEYPAKKPLQAIVTNVANELGVPSPFRNVVTFMSKTDREVMDRNFEISKHWNGENERQLARKFALPLSEIRKIVGAK